MYIVSPLPHRFKKESHHDHVVYRASDNPDDQYIKKVKATEQGKIYEWKFIFRFRCHEKEVCPFYGSKELIRKVALYIICLSFVLQSPRNCRKTLVLSSKLIFHFHTHIWNFEKTHLKNWNNLNVAEVKDAIKSLKKSSQRKRRSAETLKKKTIELLVAGDWTMLKKYGREFLPTYLLTLVNIVSFHFPGLLVVYLIGTKFRWKKVPKIWLAAKKLCPPKNFSPYCSSCRVITALFKSPPFWGWSSLK